MGYTVKTKNSLRNDVKNGMSIIAASTKYKVAYQTARNWIDNTKTTKARTPRPIITDLADFVGTESLKAIAAMETYVGRAVLSHLYSSSDNQR